MVVLVVPNVIAVAVAVAIAGASIIGIVARIAMTRTSDSLSKLQPGSSEHTNSK